jgi:hypothetical protein
MDADHVGTVGPGQTSSRIFDHYRVISSYTSTLAALTRARAQQGYDNWP